MGVKTEETIFYFKELGFTEYEAKVYIALLDHHPAGAYDISQRSSVPHSRVYDIARRLIKKGVALLVGKDPERYSPLAPAELIRKLKMDHDRYVEELEIHLDRVAFNSDFDPVWNLSTRDEALNMVRSLIHDSKKKIYIGLWDEELIELLPVFKKAHLKGVEIVFLIYGQAHVDFGKVFYHSTEAISGIQVLGRTIDCVVDSECCLSGSLGAEQACQVVWTRNRGLVKSIEEYIVHDFYLADINQRFGSEIEKAFGRNLAALRKKYGR